MKPDTKAKLIVFLNTLTLIGGAITIILILRVITNTARLNTETNDKIVASQKVTENELRCLAAFFSQTGRQNLRISNLETCEILHTDTGQTEVLPLSPTSSSPAVPSSDTKQNSTSNQDQTQPTATTNTTSQTPAASQTSPQVQSSGNLQGDGSASVQLQPSVPPPKEILGVPMCVPFTHVCVR